MNPDKTQTPLEKPEPELSVKASSSDEKKPDYSSLYDLWREKKGPVLCKRDRLDFEKNSGMEPEEAVRAARKVLESPFLLARFRSLLWLPHISKEEFFEEKARRKTGQRLYREIFDEQKSLRQAIDDYPRESRFETYKGAVILALQKDLLGDWVRPWIDEALKDSEERKLQEAKPVEYGPPLPDVPF